MFENVMHRSGAGTEVVSSKGLGHSVLLEPDSGFGKVDKVDFSIKGMDG